jgi:hypothetical protein
VEVSFTSEQHADAVLEAGMTFQDRQLLITKAFHPDMKIYSISVFGMPFRSKEETYHELINVFSKYAKVSHVKYHFYTNTDIRMDSCNIVLDFSNTNYTVGILPRQISIFGKFCDLFWYNSPKFCRYYKEEGHAVRECRLLTVRKPGRKLPHVDTPSQEDMAQFTEVQRAMQYLRSEYDDSPVDWRQYNVRESAEERATASLSEGTKDSTDLPMEDNATPSSTSISVSTSPSTPETS